MRRVGTRNEECLSTRGAGFVLYLVGLGFVFQSFAQHVLNIGDRSALACLSELMADKGIEAHAAGAEERVAVDDPVVEFVNFTAVDDLNRLLQVHRKQQVAG